MVVLGIVVSVISEALKSISPLSSALIAVIWLAIFLLEIEELFKNRLRFS
jgi:hypothetical protein